MGITRARRLIQRRICRGAVIDITVPAIVGQSWAASVAASLTGPPARCRSAAGVALVAGQHVRTPSTLHPRIRVNSRHITKTYTCFPCPLMPTSTLPALYFLAVIRPSPITQTARPSSSAPVCSCARATVVGRGLETVPAILRW